jgi:hypothetical protein
VPINITVQVECDQEGCEEIFYASSVMEDEILS